MLKNLLPFLIRSLFIPKNERRGFIVLMVLCLLCTARLTYVQLLRSPADIPELKVERLLAQLDEGPPQEDRNRVPELFPFDPNRLDSLGWVRMGFTPKQVGSILKYRKKVRFREKKDLARVYVIGDARYAELEPYIQLPVSLPKPRRREDRPWKQERTEKSVNTQIQRIDLNRAEKEELESLPFIGPKTATQIIRFRDLLGGFHSTAQLAEVYYLRDKPEALEALMPLVSVGEGAVRRISVNDAEAADLANHPFIDWKQAKALVNYRKQHGPFTELPEIKDCELISEELFIKIAPYLTTE